MLRKGDPEGLSLFKQVRHYYLIFQFIYIYYLNLGMWQIVAATRSRLAQRIELSSEPDNASEGL